MTPDRIIIACGLQVREISGAWFVVDAHDAMVSGPHPTTPFST